MVYSIATIDVQVTGYTPTLPDVFSEASVVAEVEAVTYTPTVPDVYSEASVGVEVEATAPEVEAPQPLTKTDRTWILYLLGGALLFALRKRKQ